MKSPIDLLKRDPNVGQALRDALPRDCGYCGVLIAPTHSHASFCPLYIAPPPVPYGTDGFVRDSAGRVAGFAESNGEEYMEMERRKR